MRQQRVQAADDFLCRLQKRCVQPVSSGSRPSMAQGAAPDSRIMPTCSSPCCLKGIQTGSASLSRESGGKILLEGT